MAFEHIHSYRPAGRYKPPIPAATRRLVAQRANGVCERCGDKPLLFAKLELHHRHYETEGREQPHDLMLLCRSCHRDEHVDLNGDFWADPTEKDDYWASYFSELDKD